MFLKSTSQTPQGPSVPEASLVSISLDCLSLCVCVSVDVLWTTCSHWQLMGCGLLVCQWALCLISSSVKRVRTTTCQHGNLHWDQDLTESVGCVCVCVYCICLSTYTPCTPSLVCVESGWSLTGSDPCCCVHINKQDLVCEEEEVVGRVRGHRGRRLLTDGL